MTRTCVLDGKRSVLVLERLVMDLRTGLYAEGDCLPGERDLAEACGVGRSSVREALSVLSAMGILDRRVGDGTYVRSCDGWRLARALRVAHGQPDLREVFQLQRILEAGMAELAARAGDPGELAEARSAVRDMRAAAETDDLDAYFEADRRFHLSVARATDNAQLERALRQLMDQMDQPLWRAVKGYFIRCRTDYLSRSLANHEELLVALDRNDSPRARAVMEAHFDRVEEEIFGGR